MGSLGHWEINVPTLSKIINRAIIIMDMAQSWTVIVSFNYHMAPCIAWSRPGLNKSDFGLRRLRFRREKFPPFSRNTRRLRDSGDLGSDLSIQTQHITDFDSEQRFGSCWFCFVVVLSHIACFCTLYRVLFLPDTAIHKTHIHLATISYS